VQEASERSLLKTANPWKWLIGGGPVAARISRGRRCPVDLGRTIFWAEEGAMDDRQNRKSGLRLLLRGYQILFQRARGADETPAERARAVERRFLRYTLEQRQIEREKQLYGS